MAVLTDTTRTTARSAAERAAEANFNSNLAALCVTQGDLARKVREIIPDLIWIYARDGSLTAMHPDGQWWGGCSLPVLASRAVLRSLETNDQTSCFLLPAHAGLLIAARARMNEQPALICVAPDLTALRVILSAHDFSADIRSHHLWLVAGESWPDDLRQLLLDQPGLPTPARFIKTKLTANELIEPMIPAAQRIFSDVLAERSRRLETIRAQWPSLENQKGNLLIAGSRFRLWEDAALVLREVLEKRHVTVFDCDDPATSSPLALAEAAKESATIITANISRGDAVNLTSPEARWITWITRPLIPSFATAAPRDILLLADKTWHGRANAAGWPSENLFLAGWPSRRVAETYPPQPLLAIFAHTQPIDIPPAIEDLSSHRLLWDLIQAELTENPFALTDVKAYLDDRARQLNIDPDTLDQAAFIERLIVPAYQQGIALVCHAAKVPLKLFGNGWGAIEVLKSDAADSPVSRDELDAAASCAAGFIYIWPNRYAHPIDAMRKPVLTPLGQSRQSFLRAARLLLDNFVLPPRAPSDVSLAETINQLITD